MIDSSTRQDAVRAYVRFTLNYVRDLNARGGEDQWERLAVGPVQIQGDNVVGFLGLQSTTHAERQALATFIYDGVDRSWNPKPTNVKQIRVAAKLKVPDVLKKSVVSSNVGDVSYFPGKKVLQVGFKGGGAYQYFDVPRETYDDFVTAGSKGKFFWQHIRRKGYSYRKVEMSRIVEQKKRSVDLVLQSDPFSTAHDILVRDAETGELLKSGIHSTTQGRDVIRSQGWDLNQTYAESTTTKVPENVVASFRSFVNSLQKSQHRSVQILQQPKVGAYSTFFDSFGRAIVSARVLVRGSGAPFDVVYLDGKWKKTSRDVKSLESITAANSKGKFFWQHIRNKGYSYRRVESMNTVISAVREFREERTFDQSNPKFKRAVRMLTEKLKKFYPNETFSLEPITEGDIDPKSSQVDISLVGNNETIVFATYNSTNGTIGINEVDDESGEYYGETALEQPSED